MFYYTYKELKEMCRDKMKYWSDTWNYLEILIIGFGYPTIVFYIYLKIAGSSISSKFAEKQGRDYVNLQSVAYIEEVFTYLVGFLVFCATFKFIKLLRFNKRMGLMAATLKQCAKDLRSFFVLLGIVFLAFGLFFYVHLSRVVLKYSSFEKAMMSTLVASFGKFDIQEMALGHAVLGPIMFFVFALTVIIVLTNLLLTIIIMSFAEVKKDLENRVNEYEMVDFIFNRIKMFVGMKTGKVAIVNTEEEAKLDTEENKRGNGMSERELKKMARKLTIQDLDF
ncbi:unnamed protein product [Notodromas monacha]|uniref:Polycystin cation channel PKD1/PKD2 domain-containing protein n=1 Tax=Notodromas monacha TaxID=399045 RepID=A0A7R9C323_9CRUS|nr:unnamed protein product [Notodromas monacha]CAG0925403.1 unnamed protein product [Notodromas monacha]